MYDHEYEIVNRTDKNRNYRDSRPKFVNKNKYQNALISSKMHHENWEKKQSKKSFATANNQVEVDTNQSLKLPAQNNSFINITIHGNMRSNSQLSSMNDDKGHRMSGSVQCTTSTPNMVVPYQGQIDYKPSKLLNN